jgi:hypothetical protein
MLCLWPDDSLLRQKYVAVLKYKTRSCIRLNIKIFVSKHTNTSVITYRIQEQNISWKISMLTEASATTRFVFFTFQKFKNACLNLFMSVLYVSAEYQVMMT